MNQIEAVARDPLSLILAGMGITLAPYEYLGGIVLALAGASIASAMSKETDKRSFWAVMLTAVFISTVMIQVAGSYPIGIPTPLLMSLSGFGSRPIAKFLLKTFGVFEKRSDILAEKIADKVLPDDDSKS